MDFGWISYARPCNSLLHLLNDGKWEGKVRIWQENGRCVAKESSPGSWNDVSTVCARDRPHRQSWERNGLHTRSTWKLLTIKPHPPNHEYMYAPFQTLMVLSSPPDTNSSPPLPGNMHKLAKEKEKVLWGSITFSLSHSLTCTQMLHVRRVLSSIDRCGRSIDV